MARNASRHKSGTPDYFLMAVIFILVVFGLAMLASASSNLGKTQFNDTYYYLKHQLLYGLSVGLVGLLAGYFFPYQKVKPLAFIFLLISIVFLVLVFTPLGSLVNNTNRWLDFGPIRFQPAEIMKLTYILYLAAWLSNPKFKRATDFQSGLLPFLIISGIIAILLIFQPATSIVVILMLTGLTVYFSSGAPIKYLVGTLAAGAAVIGLFVFITPYRLARVTAFLHPTSAADTSNYQVNQALIAIGSGGLFGKGYGQSTTKANYLPRVVDDSIFAVIAEELGFVGAGSLIVLFCLLTFRMFWIAKRTADPFGRYILIGFGTTIALQAFINMASISGLIPLTGVPLPFVSYGGTAFAIFLTMSGIALNISKYM